LNTCVKGFDAEGEEHDTVKGKEEIEEKEKT
jgi:hypothetical protein